MTGRLFKSGDETVVAIPSETLTRLRLTEGSEVQIDVDEAGRIVIQPAGDAQQGVSESFAHEVREFIEKYRPALDALAK